MESILDFSKPDFDVAALDSVVATFFGGGPDRMRAERVLNLFQENENAWQRVPVIVDQAQNVQSKFIGLTILDKLITHRWKIVPDDTRQGIRNYVIQTIIKVSSDETTLRREKAFVTKLNLILVQILKQDWPHDYPNFISDLVSSSKSNVSLCENNMIILKLLSEEIFDFSAEQMTSSKTKALKTSMCGEFSEIFTLCHEVLEKAVKPSLIKATLDTFLKFLAWIPFGYFLETNIIDILVNRFLEVADFRNVTLKCLSEIGQLQVNADYNQKMVILFTMVMTSVNRIVPPSTDISKVYAQSTDADQDFVANLAIFLTSFLSMHNKLIETPDHRDLLLNAHLYLIKISQVEEREIFKICLEYWNKLVQELYDEAQGTVAALGMGDMNPLMGLNLNGGMGSMLGMGAAQGAGGTNAANLRKNTYAEVMSNLRLVMIERMAKPEEVLVIENEEGEVVREFLKEIDTIQLYKTMKEVLVYLTHLDVIDTENIMTEKLARQVDDSEWSRANLNTLCWAIGSISGAMNEDTEKRFLVTVIKDLLGLCEKKRGKDNKAVVASSIMYIVGQYPRFLKAHWKFLKTVVNKLFEFMHETHEGVQDMACDTFIKIAQKCRRHFVMQQSGETEPFVDEILRSLPAITHDLTPLQVNTFYEAVGHMISAQPNKPVQEKLISKLMEMPNTPWDSLVQQAGSGSVDILADPANIKILSNVLKTNVSACTSIGAFFTPQIARNYVDMLGLYTSVSGIVSQTIATEGQIATKTVKVRGLRTIKKEILKLVEIYISKTDELESVNKQLIPPLLDAILGDYNQNVPQARDSEVLNLVATITTKLGPLMTDKIGDILAAVFECTLSMINQDFLEFPEHRVGFYKMLKSINVHCFPALLALQQAQFKLYMDSIVWAIKHTMRDIADTGLTIMLDLINNIVDSDEATANGFFQQYLLSIIQDVFFVLTDADHKAGFKNQAVLLARIFFLVEAGQIHAPLFDPAQAPTPGLTNQMFLREYCTNLLRTAFGHVHSNDVQKFVNDLFTLNQDPNKFRVALRDFLITLREFNKDGDNAELYLEETEAEKEAKAAAQRAKAEQVPGMLKPSEVQEDEEL